MKKPCKISPQDFFKISVVRRKSCGLCGPQDEKNSADPVHHWSETALIVSILFKIDERLRLIEAKILLTEANSNPSNFSETKINQSDLQINEKIQNTPRKFSKVEKVRITIEAIHEANNCEIARKYQLSEDINFLKLVIWTF